MIASTQAPNDDSVSISTGSRSGGAGGGPPPGLGAELTCPTWGQGGRAPEQQEQWRRSRELRMRNARNAKGAECEWRGRVEHQNLPPHQQSPPGSNKSHLPPATSAAPEDADLGYEWSSSGSEDRLSNDSRTNQSTDGDHRGVYMSIQENTDPNWTMCYVQNLPNRYGPATILNLLLMNDTVQGDPVFRKAMRAVMDKDIGDE